MTLLTTVKLILFAAGILIWGYGVLEGHRTIQFVGLGVVAVAAILRFAGSRLTGD